MRSAMRIAMGYVLVLAIAGTSIPLPVDAGQPDSPSLAIDAVSFDARAVDTLFTFMRLQRKELTRETWLNETIDNYLLAQEARRAYPAAQLYPGAQVGYPAEVATEERLLPILRMHFKDTLRSSIAALPGGK